MNSFYMTKSLKLSLLVIFLFQLFIAFSFELAHDEAYYWLYSKNLDWGYFDHPPFVGVIIKLFSFLPHGEFSVRIGFILLQFLSLFIIIGLTGYPTVVTLLFFSFPLASFTGLLALPDIPLLFMTACYAFMLNRFLQKSDLLTSMILGLVIALLLYAKYHGVLLIFFTIIAIPTLLKNKYFYLVAVFAILGFLPHLIWQYDHDFSTIRYHFFERPSSTFSVFRSLEFIGLQTLLAGVFVGPFVWWIIAKLKTHSPFDRAMKFISIGTVFFFLFSTFNKKVEANWTIFLAVPIIYLVGSSAMWKKKWLSNLLRISMILVLVTRILLIIPVEHTGLKRVREFQGWKSWAKEVQAMCGETPIIANSYQIASKLSFYLDQEINALNYHSRKNQFDYWRFDKNIPTKEVCYVTDKREFQGLDLLSPDGKSLVLVKNQGLNTLWALKYQ